MMKLRSILCGVLGTLLPASPALAHHSLAIFDMAKTIVIHGTLKDFSWSSPHSWVDIVVPQPDGSTQMWSLECGAPVALARNGWTKDIIRPGDKLTAELHPLKNGKPGGACLGVTLADGRQLSVGKEVIAGYEYLGGEDKKRLNALSKRSAQ